MTTWTRIEPRRSSANRLLTECQVLTTKYNGQFRLKVKLPAALCKQLDWRKGTPLEISFSRDPNATRLRLRFGKDGRCYVLQCERAASTHFVVFTPQPHPLLQPRPAQAVRHMIGEEGLILTVPAWAATGDPPPPAGKAAA